MQLLRSLDKADSIPEGCVVTVGSFDGVHTGHQKVLEELKRHAEELSLPAVVLTFEPQPREYFQPAAAPARLSTFREKFQLLREQGIDILVCLRFQESLANIPANEFVQSLFIEAMRTKRIIIGDDFRFGKNREGDINLLRSKGRECGYSVVSIDSFERTGQRVSSSSIRAALEVFDFAQAEKLLGRPYTISGRVRHGEKRGRQLGFATANIELNRITTPFLGVYAVRVHGLDGKIYQGVANIGTRPVFDGKQLLLEVHMLDFSGDIYGRYISVEFVRRLRGEEKFSSVEELLSQIKNDIAEARELFNQGARD